MNHLDNLNASSGKGLRGADDSDDLNASSGKGLLRETHHTTGRTTTTTTTTNTKVTKAVRFPADDSPELTKRILIPSLSDAPPEELSALYTTDRDHRRSLLDARNCILFARRQHQLQQQGASTSGGEPFVFGQEQEDATGYCTRGLESMQSKAILELTSLRKRLVRETVLLEQKRGLENKSQTGNDRNDQCDQREERVKRVAAASAAASSWARDRAYERAAADAAWVQQHVLLEETLAAALQASEAGVLHPQGAASTDKKRRRRSSVVTNPKSLAQSFRRLSCKGLCVADAPPQFPTLPRTHAHRPTKKTTFNTHTSIARSPSA